MHANNDAPKAKMHELFSTKLTPKEIMLKQV